MPATPLSARERRRELEIWGGPECTVNRVGDRYSDQTRLTGHHDRLDDLARFAALGITKLRYPVLWERVAPDQPDRRDWQWSDDRLREIARLGMRPIVGLLHHGSGPRYTNLVADDFVSLFADYAAAVARRYPDVTDWTPINEPLTTARFSLLYGHWYPHAHDERLFWQALLNQIDATRLAMAAIRRVNPAARLIQTEDLGQYYSTEALADTAAHFNHRRWMTWDLLAGRVDPSHPLWAHLAGFGFGDRLRAIADDPCPPNIIGVNHYPTSERFLDHRLDAYPGEAPSTGYHDFTALRLLDPPPPGAAALLRQVWDRYRIPLAITESHLGCTREEQLRWLWQTWRTCHALAEEGVDIQALTAWALVGNMDWTSLITVEAGDYEPGAFDARHTPPRPTAVACLLEVLSRGEAPSAAEFPVLQSQGWWQRSVRLEHASIALPGITASAAAGDACPPLVIGDGGSGWAQAFVGECMLRGLPHLPGMPTEPDLLASWLDAHQPWAVIFLAKAAQPALLSLCAERAVRCAILSRGHATSFPPGALVIRVPDGRDTCATQLARLCLDILIDGETGSWDPVPDSGRTGFVLMQRVSTPFFSASHEPEPQAAIAAMAD